MKRSVMLVCALFFAVSCDDGPSSPSPGTPLPTTINFTATLSALNENPPITNSESGGRGAARIQFNLTRDAAGAITNATANMVYDVTGLPAGSTITLTHIHEGASSVNGPVRVDTGLTPATGVVLATGAQSNLTYNNRPVGAALANQIIANPNGFYFNVHTTINGAGVMRGQLAQVVP